MRNKIGRITLRRYRRSFSAWVDRITPRSFGHHPFEYVIATLGIFIGFSSSIDPTRSAILMGVTGIFFVHAWSASMLIGGLTLAFGITKQRFDVIATGLQVLSMNFLAYGASVIINTEVRGTTGLATIVGMGLAAFVRGAHFRRVEELKSEGGRE